MNLPNELAGSFPARPLDVNKHTAGMVTVVGGSPHFIHAPVIAALGARVAGAGLVHMVVPDATRLAAASIIPEATFTKLTPTCVPPKCDVVVSGMGLGVSPNSELLVSRLLSGSAGLFVLDADALNVLSKWYADKPKAIPAVEGQTIILTPHVGEAARLLATSADAILANRNEAIRALVSRYHAVVVLKGPHTLVAAPDREMIWQCEAGNPFMALGGMGDLLAGIVAARWATLTRRGVGVSVLDTAFRAAAGAVWLHATAADELIRGENPEDPSILNTAHRVASLRVKLERGT